MILDNYINNKAGEIIYRYILRTGLELEEANILIRKSASGVDLFRPHYLEYCKVEETVNILIGATLMIKTPDDNYKITDKDKSILKYMKHEKAKYVQWKESLKEAFEVLEQAFKITEELIIKGEISVDEETSKADINKYLSLEKISPLRIPSYEAFVLEARKKIIKKEKEEFKKNALNTYKNSKNKKIKIQANKVEESSYFRLVKN